MISKYKLLPEIEMPWRRTLTFSYKWSISVNSSDKLVQMVSWMKVRYVNLNVPIFNEACAIKYWDTIQLNAIVAGEKKKDYYFGRFSKLFVHLWLTDSLTTGFLLFYNNKSPDIFHQSNIDTMIRILFPLKSIIFMCSWNLDFIMRIAIATM